MDSENVVSVQNVSMMFNISSEKYDSLKEYIINLLKGKLLFKEFWALQDVNFDIKKGERVALIGLNGSGKSTLLKIIAGVMKPTIGKVVVKGSVAPMIELGAGFDPNLSAKENIYLNGAILGYSDKEIDEQYDNIIKFAELKDFENVAIKNFSSGMYARLGFAIATAKVADILIVDEVLAVGDYTFQTKCQERIEYLTSKGTTVLFVSHNPKLVTEMCNKAIWLEKGKIVKMGEAKQIISEYQDVEYE